MSNGIQYLWQKYSPDTPARYDSNLQLNERLTTVDEQLTSKLAADADATTPFRDRTRSGDSTTLPLK